MISLGIPKLVRFHKSRSDNIQVFNYLWTANPAARHSCALHRIRESPSSWLKARWQQYPRLFSDSGSYWFGDEGVPFSQAIRQRKIGQVLVRSGMILGNLLVFVLALVGVIARRSQVVQLSEIILFPIFLALVALPLWIEPRYGLPMMPCVAILSAMGAFEIGKIVRMRFV